jgi:zinc/manganese transport system substrate-binding protein
MRTHSLILILTMALSAASTLFSPALGEPLKVVASFSILGDFAANVGGERVAITTLVGPNSDAHVYEPRPADAVALSQADVILANGLHFEGFLPRLIEVSGANAPLIELTHGSNMLKPEQNNGLSEFDPHAWQSVRNAQVYVKNIATAFCTADAVGCDTYKANAIAYLGKLEMLDTEIKTMVADIPLEKRVVITSHDAFGYFAREYRIKFLAPEGIATDSEASAADVAALITQIRQEKATALFVENISDPRLMDQISSETGVTIGGALFSDALSDHSGPAPTYIEMMRHNAQMLKGALSES